MANWDDFRVARRLRRFQRWVAVVLLLLLFWGINRFSVAHPLRKNLSGRFAPPVECVELASQLAHPVEVIVVHDDGENSDENAKFHETLLIFLKNTAALFQSKNVPFDFQFFHRHYRSTQLRQWFSALRPQLPIANGIYVRVADEVRLLSLSTCGLFSDGELSGFNFSDGFLGALKSLANPEPFTVHLVDGHGERAFRQRPTESSLSRLKLWVERQGWKAESMQISQIEGIKPSHSVVLIADPKIPYQEAECNALQRFLDERNGNLLLMLTPESCHGLGALLQRWNIIENDTLPAEFPSDLEEGILIRNLGKAPLLRPLLEWKLPIQFESIRPLEVAVSSASSSLIQGEILMETTANGVHALFPIAIAVQRQLPSNLPLDLPSGKLVVVGGDFLGNRHFSLLGNQLFFQQLCAHFLNGQPPLPTAVAEYRLPMDRQEFIRLGRIVLLLPFALLLLPVFRHLLKRNSSFE